MSQDDSMDAEIEAALYTISSDPRPDAQSLELPYHNASSYDMLFNPPPPINTPLNNTLFNNPSTYNSSFNHEPFYDTPFYDTSFSESPQNGFSAMLERPDYDARAFNFAAFSDYGDPQIAESRPTASTSYEDETALADAFPAHQSLRPVHVAGSHLQESSPAPVVYPFISENAAARTAAEASYRWSNAEDIRILKICRKGITRGTEIADVFVESSKGPRSRPAVISRYRRIVLGDPELSRHRPLGSDQDRALYNEALTKKIEELSSVRHRLERTPAKKPSALKSLPKTVGAAETSESGSKTSGRVESPPTKIDRTRQVNDSFPILSPQLPQWQETQPTPPSTPDAAEEDHAEPLAAGVGLRVATGRTTEEAADDDFVLDGDGPLEKRTGDEVKGRKQKGGVSQLGGSICVVRDWAAWDLNEELHLLKTRQDNRTAGWAEIARLHSVSYWDNDPSVRSMQAVYKKATKLNALSISRVPSMIKTFERRLAKEQKDEDVSDLPAGTIEVYSAGEHLSILKIHRAHRDQTYEERAELHNRAFWPNGPVVRTGTAFNKRIKKLINKNDDELDAKIAELEEAVRLEEVGGTGPKLDT